MIWAIVSSWSCFCWLCRASPSLAAKNIISLTSVLTIWCCPCVELSYVLFERVFANTSASLGKALLAFALLHFVLQGQICLLLQVSLDFLLLRPSPLWWKGHLFLVFVLEDLVGLHKLFNFSFFGISGWGIHLGLLWHWMTCLGNKQRSFCHFWDCNQVLHFGLFLTMSTTPFILRDSYTQ